MSGILEGQAADAPAAKNHPSRGPVRAAGRTHRHALQIAKDRGAAGLSRLSSATGPSARALIDLFCPESSLEAGRNSLSVALSSLRNQLEPPGTPANAVLRADRFSVGLNPAAVTTDVLEFERALQQSAQADSAAERTQLLAQAADLYQERLLPGYYEDWIGIEQERLSGLFFEGVTRLITHLEARGDLSAALHYARRAVRADALREEAHKALMRLLAASGQPGAALRQYREMERLLHAGLGVEPSAPLRALAR